MPHSPRFTDYTREDWQDRRRAVLHDYAAGLPGLSSEARHRMVDAAEAIAAPNIESHSRPAAAAARPSARAADGVPGASPNWSRFIKLPE